MSDVTTELTDGAGVSALTRKKFIKDLCADFLMSVPVSIGGITLFSVASDKAVGLTVALGVGNAAIGAGYRAWLRWATTS